MDDKKTIYGLMVAAKSQQQAIDQAIKRLTDLIHKSGTVADQMQLTERNLEPALRQAAKRAIRAEMGDAASQASLALENATQPLLQRLDGVGQEAARTEKRMRRAGAWVSGLPLFFVSTGAISIVLVAYLTAVYLANDVGRLRAERAQLQEEVALLKDEGDGIQLATCGKEGSKRLCARIDPKAGHYGDGGVYRVLVLRK